MLHRDSTSTAKIAQTCLYLLSRRHELQQTLPRSRPPLGYCAADSLRFQQEALQICPTNSSLYVPSSMPSQHASMQRCEHKGPAEFVRDAGR
jgi:hypothetical protein